MILEEIAMDQDDRRRLRELRGATWALTLGRPIGGTPEEIQAVPRDAVWEHYKRYLHPPGSPGDFAAGSRHSTMVRLVLESLTRHGWDLRRACSPRRAVCKVPTAASPYRWSELARGAEGFEQTNIVMGRLSIIAGDDRRYALSVLTSAFGAGMSSRLFQEIREKRGLAYSTSLRSPVPTRTPATWHVRRPLARQDRAGARGHTRVR